MSFQAPYLNEALECIEAIVSLKFEYFYLIKCFHPQFHNESRLVISTPVTLKSKENCKSQERENKPWCLPCNNKCSMNKYAKTWQVNSWWTWIEHREMHSPSVLKDDWLYVFKMIYNPSFVCFVVRPRGYAYGKGHHESSVHRNPYDSHDTYDAIRTQDADLAVSQGCFACAKNYDAGPWDKKWEEKEKLGKVAAFSGQLYCLAICSQL